MVPPSSQQLSIYLAKGYVQSLPEVIQKGGAILLQTPLESMCLPYLRKGIELSSDGEDVNNSEQQGCLETSGLVDQHYTTSTYMHVTDL
ncbi:hypothetical protein J6590_069821 [Homalodisca vitripennis]|nr:hypothetical protein J6590_069821 [Homalodisca vitripennis]